MIRYVFEILATLVLVALLGLGAAHADQGGEGNNTNCNGQGNPGSPCGGDEGGPGNGGNGGNGGAGGVGNGGASASTSTSTGGSSSVDSHDVYKGDDYEAAASAPALYLSGCQAGAAAQGMGFGAALGKESKLCQRLRLVAAYQALGMHFQAAEELREASYDLHGGHQIGDPEPFLVRWSRSFKLKIVNPALGWLPGADLIL